MPKTTGSYQPEKRPGLYRSERHGLGRNLGTPGTAGTARGESRRGKRSAPSLNLIKNW